MLMGKKYCFLLKEKKDNQYIMLQSGNWLNVGCIPHNSYVGDWGNASQFPNTDKTTIKSAWVEHEQNALQGPYNATT